MKFDALEYGEVITRDLKVADMTAITLCSDNNLPILVFELLTEGNIARAVKGEKIGTLVSDQGTRAGPGDGQSPAGRTPCRERRWLSRARGIRYATENSRPNRDSRSKR